MHTGAIINFNTNYDRFNFTHAIATPKKDQKIYIRIYKWVSYIHSYIQVGITIPIISTIFKLGNVEAFNEMNVHIVNNPNTGLLDYKTFLKLFIIPIFLHYLQNIVSLMCRTYGVILITIVVKYITYRSLVELRKV